MSVLVSVSRPDIRLEALTGIALGALAISIGALLSFISPNPYGPNLKNRDSDKRRHKGGQGNLS